MNTLNASLGWLFASIAALFALGLISCVAPHFYPTSPDFRVRLAAPLIFLLLAAAGFGGFAFPALVLVVALGTVQIVISHWKKRGQRLAP